jgi:hypothetical protein
VTRERLKPRPERLIGQMTRRREGGRVPLAVTDPSHGIQPTAGAAPDARPCSANTEPTRASTGGHRHEECPVVTLLSDVCGN